MTQLRLFNAWSLLVLVAVVSLRVTSETRAAEDAPISTTIVRKPGDDGSKAFRIPGLATSVKGTLLAVYDIRYDGFGDLPGDIDVGLRRSLDSGKTWEPQQVIIDFDKQVPQSRGNGVGDPAILVDRKTGAIFVIALWSQGNRAWHGSGPGLTPAETGQLVLVKSVDDGKTWSKPINLTDKISDRDPTWRLFFNGPGAGIQTRDGTLIFAAQYRAADGTPHSCFLASRDAGETWAVSAAAIPEKPPTSEAQLAELSDGSLLLTMRDESRSGQRAWSRFRPEKKLPAGTWDKWRSELPDSTCMASLVRHPSGALIFSNPASSKSRVGMTLRVSDDDGVTWSAGKLLDPRPAAYSCLSILADGTIGILYEAGEKNSAETMVFANVTLEWIRSGKTEKIGKLKLAPVFSNSMVLQRNQLLPIFGHASPQTEVSVEFGSIQRSATSDTKGRWRVDLPALVASKEPRGLTVSCGNETIHLRDVLVGDVWLCSGQSNMEFPLAQSADAAEALANAKLPQLRLLDLRPATRGVYAKPFAAEMLARLTPELFFQGSWQGSTPETARDFSAIGFEFGHALQQRLDVPMGIIQVAVGGSPTEAWIARESLAQDPALKPLVAGDWLHNPAIAGWCRERGEQNLRTANGLAPRDHLGYNHPFKPGFLWASGIEPLLPFAVRGVLWYQGESNAQDLLRLEQHMQLFPLLVHDWRKHWQQPDMPFLFCQLSSIGTAGGYPAQHWPAFRDQQRRHAEQLKQTAMVVTSDVGHPTDVHPQDKRTVAQRLFQAAMTVVYGQNSAFQGPRPTSIARQNQQLIITFRETGQGLRTSDNQLPASLELGDEARRFVPAEGRLRNDSLVISLADDARFKYVRYGWQPYSQGNLTDSDKLPASTFELTIPAAVSPRTRER